MSLERDNDPRGLLRSDDDAGSSSDSDYAPRGGASGGRRRRTAAAAAASAAGSHDVQGSDEATDSRTASEGEQQDAVAGTEVGRGRGCDGDADGEVGEAAAADDAEASDEEVEGDEEYEEDADDDDDDDDDDEEGEEEEEDDGEEAYLEEGLDDEDGDEHGLATPLLQVLMRAIAGGRELSEEEDEGSEGVRGTARQLRLRTPQATAHPHEQAQAAAMQRSELTDSVMARTGGEPRTHPVRQLAERAMHGSWSPVARAHIAQRFVPTKLSGLLRAGRRVRVYSSQFSSSGDLLVVANQGDCVQVFDTKSWQVHKVIEARDVYWTVTSTDLSPDERFLIYTSIHEHVHLCNVYGSHEIHERLDLSGGGEGFGIWCCKFSADGTELLAGANDNSLIVFDVERKVALHRIRAHADDINAVAFADAGHRSPVFFSGSDDSLIKVWDRRELGQSRAPAGVLPGHTEGITSLSSRGDGRHLLSNAKDQSAKLWDLRAMTSSRAFQQLPPQHRRFTWDYRWMDYPGWGRPYKHPHDKSIMTYRGHSVLGTLIRAHFSPEFSTGQRFVYTGSHDGVVYIYDSITGELVHKLRGHRGPVRDASWHPFFPIMCSASWDGTVGLWKPREPTPSAHRHAAGAAGATDAAEEEEEEEEDGADAVGDAGTAGARRGVRRSAAAALMSQPWWRRTRQRREALLSSAAAAAAPAGSQ